ncbi:trichohyalin, partial [Reticulomyxa filosa]
KSYEIQEEAEKQKFQQTDEKTKTLREKIEKETVVLNDISDKNRNLIKEAKEKDKELRKLKTKSEQEKQQLSSHQQAVDRMKHDFEAKLNTEELEKGQLQIEEKELQKELSEQKRLIEEIMEKQSRIEEEKANFVDEKKKDVERDILKEDADKVLLEKDLSAKDEQLRQKNNEIQAYEKSNKDLEGKLDSLLTRLNTSTQEQEQTIKQIQELKKAQKEALLDYERIQLEHKQCKEQENNLKEANKVLSKRLNEKIENEQDHKEREQKIIEKENTLKQKEEQKNYPKWNHHQLITQKRKNHHCPDDKLLTKVDIVMDHNQKILAGIPYISIELSFHFLGYL